MAFASAQEAVAALAARSASLADLREIVTRFPELRPVVAAYPQTDQPLLDWLGGLHDPLIDAQLAKRPGVTEFAETVFRPDPARPGATPPTPDLEPTVVRPLIQGLPGPSANPTPPSYSSNYPAGYDGQNRPPVPGAAFTPGPQQVPAQADAPLGQAADKGRKRSALPVIAISVLALVLVGGGVWAAFATGHYDAKFTKKSTLATYDVSIGGQPATGWIKTDKDTAKGPGGIKRVVLTMWLPDQHLSMSVEGNTKTSMWAAFDLVRIRPLAQLLGHPDGTEPDEAPITAVSR